MSKLLRGVYIEDNIGERGKQGDTRSLNYGSFWGSVLLSAQGVERFRGTGVLASAGLVYIPPAIWGSYYHIPKAIFYLLKRDYLNPKP